MILPVGLQFNKNYQTEAKSAHPLLLQTSGRCALPSINTTDTLQISFKSAEDKQIASILRYLDGLPCAYSGRPMLSQEKFKKLDANILQEPAQISLAYLNKYRQYMFPHELKIFSMLKKVSKKSPNKNIRGLLFELRPKAVKKLEEKEIYILKKVKTTTKRTMPEYYSQVAFLVDDAIEKIKLQREGHYFKREDFLTKLHDVAEVSNNSQQFKYVLRAAHNLPTSGSDIFAFIVKYTQKNPLTNDWTDRRSIDIAKRLIVPSLVSTEHIKPESHGGEDSLYNYLRVCAMINHKRSNIPLNVYMESYPMIAQNLQKYLEDAIILSKQGKLGKYRDYPVKIARAVFEESKGKIELNLKNYYDGNGYTKNFNKSKFKFVRGKSGYKKIKADDVKKEILNK